jgi:MFS family permease
LALACTLASNTFVAMAILLPPVLAPLAAVQMGFAESETGLFMALVSITGTAAAIASGTLLLRIGPIRLLQLSLLFCAVGLICLALAQFWLAVIAAMIMGVGYGTITPACSQILFQVSPVAHRSMIFSINQTGVPLGGVLAGTLLPILSLQYGWQASALFAGLSGMVIALAVAALRTRAGAENGPSVVGERRETLAGIRLVLRVASLRRMILPSISYAIVQLCLGTFLVSFLTLNVGFDLAGAGAVLAIAQAAGIGGRILWGWVADRAVNAWKVLASIGVLMAASTFLVASFLPSWPHWVVLVIGVIQGGTAIGWNGVYLAEVARLAPTGKAGAVTGGALSLTMLGSMFGPPLFTFIVQMSGSYSTAFNFIALFALFGGLSCLWPPNRHAPSTA